MIGGFSVKVIFRTMVVCKLGYATNLLFTLNIQQIIQNIQHFIVKKCFVLYECSESISDR